MRIDFGVWGRSSLMALAACLTLGEGNARAQYGLGGGGFGYGGLFNYRAPEVDYLNQKSLLNASRATMGPVQNNVYANNPNAYINQLHDPGLLDRYDVGTRRSIEASIGRYSDGPPPGREPTARPSPAATPPAAPAIPISSFFDRYSKLVWPDESPAYGDLTAKRAASDQACLAVLNEYNLRGLAQVGTVTEARSKLLEYGRPALQYIRDNSTPRVADGFHLFLLSLYESLAQAATIPKQPAAARRPAPEDQTGRGFPMFAGWHRFGQCRIGLRYRSTLAGSGGQTCCGLRNGYNQIPVSESSICESVTSTQVPMVGSAPS